MTEEQPNLSRTETYKIELRPSQKIVEGVYLGYSDNKHIFTAEVDGKKGYLVLDNHWICSNEAGIISYISLSSVPISFLPKEGITECTNLERIIKELETEN